MDLGLKDKVAMVAGASKGLGFGVARALASEGALVSMASRNTSAIQEAEVKMKRETTGQVYSCATDVRSATDLERWCDETVKRFGGVDLLFVNSGGPPPGGFLSFDDRTWQDTFELLLLSAVRMVRNVLPIMKQRGGGSIVFSASASVKEPIENLTLSNVVRASIPALAKTLAREFAADNIRCNTVIPGRIDTDRVRELDAVNAQRKNVSVEELKKSMSSAIPLGRYGTTDEYARAVIFLLSPVSSYITGATLQVDGGLIRSVF